MPVLVDTDVMVDYLRGFGRAVAFVETNLDHIVLSCIVVAELYAGARGEQEEATLDEFVSLFPVAPVTADVARAAGLIRRDYGLSHNVGLADAILAATARSEKADLATLNVRHYPMLKGIRAPYAKR